MKVLVACEFSGIVREAFRRKGHDAWSCDFLPTEIPSDKHLIGNVGQFFNRRWDLMIAHPPCTYLTCAGNKWFNPEYAHRFPDRRRKRGEAIQFVEMLWNAPIKKIAIENPIGVLSTQFGKPDQIIQPYQFGHADRKATCLWLQNLPPLIPTKIVEPKIKRNKNGKTASVSHDMALRLPADERWKARSRTYLGIAEAMADQWGNAIPLEATYEAVE